MQKSKITLAVHNNAEWCSRVWRIHGLPIHKEEQMWFCPFEVPKFYPNVVTTRRTGAYQIRRISEIRGQTEGRNFGVKDSFAEFDFGELQLQRLFDANWLYLSKSNTGLDASSLDWMPIRTEAELRTWEEHWDTRDCKGDAIFLPGLLIDPMIRFWAGYLGNRIVAGYISNMTGPVVGISNVFGQYEACVAHAVHEFSNLDIVCFESVEMAPNATNLGFDIVGDLTIWVTS